MEPAGVHRANAQTVYGTRVERSVTFMVDLAPGRRVAVGTNRTRLEVGLAGPTLPLGGYRAL
jgi:hypothetical protein